MGRGILTTLPGTQERRWCGADGYSVAGKMFATWCEGEIVLRLPAAEREAARARGETQPWNPRGWGKPMADWVIIPEPRESFEALAVAAHAYGLRKAQADGGDGSRRRRRGSLGSQGVARERSGRWL